MMMMMTPGYPSSTMNQNEMYEMSDGQLAVTIPSNPISQHSGQSSGATGVQLTPIYGQMYPSPHMNTGSTYTTTVLYGPQQTMTTTNQMLPSPVILYQQQQQQQPQQQSMLIYDTSISSFENRSVKLNFIRKVLVVLFTQIGICFLVINLFNTSILKEWIKFNAWFLYLVVIASIVILTLLACFAEIYQDCPVNIILMGIFTLCSALSLGSASAFSFSLNTISQDSHLLYFFDVTLIITFALIFSLLLYSWQSWYDFNVVNCIKYVVIIITSFTTIYLLLIILWSPVLAMFLPTVAFSATAGLAFTLYVITDLTFMIRRCYYNGLTPNSIVLGIIYLHTDIINPTGNFWGKC